MMFRRMTCIVWMVAGFIGEGGAFTAAEAAAPAAVGAFGVGEGE